MRLPRFQELAQSWKTRIKHRRNRDEGIRNSVGSQPSPPDTKDSNASDPSANSTQDSKLLVESEISEVMTEAIRVQEQLISELPFHDEDTIPTTASDKIIEFRPFPRLPPELRNKIWEHICYIRRNVELKSWDYGSYVAIPTLDDHTENPWQVWMYRSNTVPPAILSVSSESRAIGLRHYELDWGTHYTFRGFTFSTPATTYVNYHADSIVMAQRFQDIYLEDCGDFLRRSVHKVRFLALNIKADRRSECPYIKPFLERVLKNHTVSSLEEIILFSMGDDTSWPGDRLGFKKLPKDWTTAKDRSSIVLKRRKDWVQKQLYTRKLAGKRNGNMTTIPRIHFRCLCEAEGTNRY